MANKNRFHPVIESSRVNSEWKADPGLSNLIHESDGCSPGVNRSNKDEPLPESHLAQEVVDNIFDYSTNGNAYLLLPTHVTGNQRFSWEHVPRRRLPILVRLLFSGPIPTALNPKPTIDRVAG
ncbi:hypothetical protein V499_01178 [Pseudogymnoascus sp. VKM F-103]|nr:hypothetical protein V499_01178 [Pseudogymnoascus sp. VKM F-103]